MTNSIRLNTYKIAVFNEIKAYRVENQIKAESIHILIAADEGWVCEKTVEKINNLVTHYFNIFKNFISQIRGELVTEGLTGSYFSLNSSIDQLENYLFNYEEILKTTSKKIFNFWIKYGVKKRQKGEEYKKLILNIISEVPVYLEDILADISRLESISYIQENKTDISSKTLSRIESLGKKINHRVSNKSVNDRTNFLEVLESDVNGYFDVLESLIDEITNNTNSSENIRFTALQILRYVGKERTLLQTRFDYSLHRKPYLPRRTMLMYPDRAEDALFKKIVDQTCKMLIFVEEKYSYLKSSINTVSDYNEGNKKRDSERSTKQNNSKNNSKYKNDNSNNKDQKKQKFTRSGKKEMSPFEKALVILGLSPNATLKDAKDAYRLNLHAWHPDKFPENPEMKKKAEIKVIEINKAFELLKSYL